MRGTLLTNNGDVAFDMAFKNNLAATTAPTANDDVTAGYEAGSTWIVTATGFVYTCVSAAEGAASWVTDSAGETTPGQITAPNASTPTGAGGDAKMTGGAGGTTSGDGGDAYLQGGAATAGNSNGGDVFLHPGAGAGSGFSGNVVHQGLDIVQQGAPTAKTVSATLTAAEIKAGIITVNQGAGAASAQQLPLATAMDTAFPNVAAGYAYDFSVINISTVDAEDASLTTNTGWTLVGSMDVPAYSAAGSLNSSGRFRARKTGTGAWTLYRLS